MASINMGAVLGDIIKGAITGLTGGPAGALIGGITAGVQDVVGKSAGVAPTASAAASAVVTAINNSETVAVVPVTPATQTPTTWITVVGMILSIGSYFGLPADIAPQITSGIAGVTALVLWVEATFYKKSVTPTAVAASQPNGTSTV